MFSEEINKDPNGVPYFFTALHWLRELQIRLETRATRANKNCIKNYKKSVFIYENCTLFKVVG